MKLYRGPAYHTESTAAFVPTGYLVVASIKLNLWQNTYLQYFSALFILCSFIAVIFFFGKRLKKIKPAFAQETVIGKTISIICVNLFIFISYALFFYFIINEKSRE